MARGLGIDIGSEWIKVVQVQCSGRSVTVSGALKIPRAAVAGEGEAEGGESGLPPPGLGQELARAGLGRTGTIGISGREVNLKYVASPPMPPEKLRMMMDLQVGERLVPGRKAEGSAAVTYDFRILNVPTGLKGDLILMAGVARNEFLNDLYSAGRAARLSLRRVVPSAFGLVQAYLRTQKVSPGETVVLVDVGHRLMELAILTDESVYFARSAPGGGARFDQALVKLLKLDTEKARDFKHHRARVLPEGAKTTGAQEAQFQVALREGADVIANAIRSSLMFCRTQAKLPKLDYQKVFLSGGGARLNGLKEYLEQKVKRPVQILDLYSGLDLRRLDAASARCFEGVIPDMAVALGLAIIDADPRSIHFQLLPERVLHRRMFWNKTVYGLVAGLVLMAGLYLPYRYADEAQAQATKEAERYAGLIQEAQKRQKDFAERLKENRRLTRQTDFYARQARLGPVYLNLMAKLRDAAPRGLTISFLGAAGENGPHNMSAAPSAYYETPLRDLQVRGSYDPETLKNFNDVISQFFSQLKEVQGVEGAQLDLSYSDKEENLPPGLKGFQFNLRLANPEVPLPAPAAREAAPALHAMRNQAGQGTE